MKRNFFRSGKGILTSVAIATVIMLILHVDFWNWGSGQKIFMGWLTQEFLYRVILLLIVIPIVNYIIILISWPDSKK